MILSMILFRFKRPKKGMPFLRQEGASDVGAYITISLLITTSFINDMAENNIYFYIPVFFIIICGITIFFWWRNKLTENYLKKLKEREVGALEKEVEQLKLYNETLSKIIHKDNKLIPAMELSVKTVISETGRNASPDEREKLQNILFQLESLSKERAGILHLCDSEAKSSYSTGVPSIDHLLQYLSARAYSQQIHFEVNISQKLHTVVPDVISEDDLRTLIADLTENALLAVKDEVRRNVLVHTKLEQDIFCIEFYDSGVLFIDDVLSTLGQQRITTRKEEGGSGIGYMTAFEILKRCRASLIIDQSPIGETYKKKVSIHFDSRGEYRSFTSAPHKNTAAEN